MPKKNDPVATDPNKRLMPPADGAVVRMYRIGHGDCFLVAFAGDKKDQPVYVLIDCGYKPGSPGFIKKKTTPKEITQNIREATGGHIHVAVITHEHQDHVNGITESNFKGITIDRTWLAWTEDPKDDIANQLRKAYKDKLLGLIAARNQLALGGDDTRRDKIDNFLAFELGGEEEVFDPQAARELLGVAGAGGGSMNKKAMQIFKDRAAKGVKFLLPHGDIETLPGAKKVRVFALGPPRDVTALKDLDPQGEEEFHSAALAMASSGNYFAAAAVGAETNPGERADRPFAKRYQVDWQDALSGNDPENFFKIHYGQKGDAAIFSASSDEPDELPEDKVTEIPLNAEWRRIDNEWLHSAENLALAMNSDTNNASLVLAFELGKGGKVLLFVGDAQRGNWMSWSKADWTEGRRKITAKDLLSRTVLYKVGHHCSHNATLNGQLSDDYANIGWMGTGKYGDEFVAMITAVRAWAKKQNGWNHPLKAIKDELIKKASGRVFQTDTEFDDMPSEKASKAEWAAFRARTKDDRLYFDYEIPA